MSILDKIEATRDKLTIIRGMSRLSSKISLISKDKPITDPLRDLIHGREQIYYFNFGTETYSIEKTKYLGGLVTTVEFKKGKVVLYKATSRCKDYEILNDLYQTVENKYLQLSDLEKTIWKQLQIEIESDYKKERAC